MTRNETTPIEDERRSTGRYASLSLGDGSVLVYDLEDTTRWVQSDAAVPREAVR